MHCTLLLTSCYATLLPSPYEVHKTTSALTEHLVKSITNYWQGIYLK